MYPFFSCSPGYFRKPLSPSSCCTWQRSQPGPGCHSFLSSSLLRLPRKGHKPPNVALCDHLLVGHSITAYVVAFRMTDPCFMYERPLVFVIASVIAVRWPGLGGPMALRLPAVKGLLSSWLAAGVLADIFIAVSLVWHLVGRVHHFLLLRADYLVRVL